MTRLQSAESKPTISKRKGNRSVSTLTPAQLARKRANDREAQRAIRARTKEHIERLEQELEGFRNSYSRDEIVQGLIKRNKALEQEVAALRESLGLQQTGRSLPSTPYEGSLSPSAVSRVSSRASSFGQNSAEYTSVPSFGPSYVPAPDPREAWASVLSCPVPSIVSSPASSLGNSEDYMAGYIPTSVPTGMGDGGVIQQPVLPCLDHTVKLEQEDVESNSSICSQPHSTPPHPATYMPQNQNQWPLYGMYYSQPPAL